MSDFRDDVVEYITKTFNLEDDLLKDIIHQQSLGGGPMMNIGPDQGKFLSLLIKIHRPRRVLEIGSYYGYSAVWIGRALKNNLEEGLYADASPLLTCIEKSEKQIDIIRDNLSRAGLSAVTELLEGDALSCMQNFDLESLDMIFIDADKANYPKYFMLAGKILRQGGLLLVDNALGLYDNEVLYSSNDDKRINGIRSFNQLLADSEIFDSSIIPLQSGLAIAVKRYQ